MNFQALTDYIDTLQNVGVPGCDMVVFQDHKEICRHMAGWRDAGHTQPMRGDEIYWIYSCTKVFTSCAAMQLIEQEKMNLDDPVSRYLPAYANLTVKNGDKIRPAERTMTVRHLLSMQSGLSYDFDRPVLHRLLEQTGRKATTRQVVETFAQDPLEFEPGTDFLYSLSHDVLAAVIEAVSGMRFSEYLKKFIFDPLGLTTVGFELTPEKQERMCAAYMVDETGKPVHVQEMDPPSYRFCEGYESGGAGLLCDVKDYITFVDTLACGGVSGDGVRILLPETIQLWSANQLGTKSRKTFDAWNRKGYSYGLGVRTRVVPDEGGKGQVGEFGWDGAACAWSMVDPYNHLSAYYSMHVRNFGYAYDVIHPRIRDLIYRSLV